MRIFKLKQFARWAKKQGLSDDILKNAIAEIDKGLVDADLGGNIYKKRIAAKGKGKSGGVRTILTYSQANKTFYLYGFEKSDKDNIVFPNNFYLKIFG